MKNSLEHLPEDKQAELRLIRDVILEKIPNVCMIVLFGSYARGDYVEDTHVEGHITHVYESDYDILVATKSIKDVESANLHDIINQAIRATGVSAPLSLIYHKFTEVKERVLDGQYFFTDIKKEGIHLYQDGKHNLDKTKTLSPEKRQVIAQEDFDQWFESAKGFYRQFEYAFNDQENKIAAFQLHQAVERFYSAITLVFVYYRFRTHDIELLGVKAASYDRGFRVVFPMDTPEYEESFKLLKRAYIDARYKKGYTISKEQLEYLGERVAILRDLTEKICIEKIKSFMK